MTDDKLWARLDIIEIQLNIIIRETNSLNNNAHRAMTQINKMRRLIAERSPRESDIDPDTKVEKGLV